MLELQAVQSDVVGCYAGPGALDRLGGNVGLTVRVAPTELLLLGERRRLPEIELELAGLDEGSVVFDLSSAFAIWALRGDERLEAFCRLSQIDLPAPPAVAQGLVAHVPGKVVVLDEELLMLVPSVLAHHLRERVLQACADLSPVEVTVRTLEPPVEQAALA